MLRNKSNSYKRKRQEINDMTAELQLLKRTEELLKEQVEQIKSRMVRKDFFLFIRKTKFVILDG
jgi:hypothetical protein